MKSAGPIFFFLALILATLLADKIFTVKAQGSPQVYQLTTLNRSTGYGTATVYKIQDGQCSVYVAVGSPGPYGVSPVAISTGQGCK